MSNILRGLTLNEGLYDELKAEGDRKIAAIKANPEAYSKQYGIPLDHKHFIGAVLVAMDREEQREKQIKRDADNKARYDASRQQQLAQDKENIDQLKAQLAQLDAQFDPSYEYSDDYTFWIKQKDIGGQIRALKKRISDVEGQQLDELSPQTLASYKKKAGADATAADKRGDFARGNKRMSGIMQATRKEFDNDEKQSNARSQIKTDDNLRAYYAQRKQEKQDVEEVSRRGILKGLAAAGASAIAPAFAKGGGGGGGGRASGGGRTTVGRGPQSASHVSDAPHSTFHPGSPFYPVVGGHGGGTHTANDADKKEYIKFLTSYADAIRAGKMTPEMRKWLNNHPEVIEDLKRGKYGLTMGQLNADLVDIESRKNYHAMREESIGQETLRKDREAKAEWIKNNPLMKDKNPVQQQAAWAIYSTFHKPNADKNKEQGVAEAEKNPHTSALGKALYRDLSKEKKASPAQVQRNKERWAKRQAEKEQGNKDMKIDELAINEDWQKVNKKDKTDGMSSKAVKAYRRENPGSKLKTAVTTKPSKLKKGSKAAKRRKSFCARMSGMKKAHASAKTKRDPDSPINKALRRWNCESIEQMEQLVMIAEQKIAEAKNAKQQAAIAIAKKAAKKG